MSAATVGPPTREMPIPARPGQTAYEYGRARAEARARQRAERAEQDRREHLAALDQMHAWVVGQTLATLREEAERQERLLWARVATMTLDLRVGPDPTLADVLAVMPPALTVALTEELALYAADIAAHPARRKQALDVIDRAWLTGRRAYLTEVAA